MLARRSRVTRRTCARSRFVRIMRRGMGPASKHRRTRGLGVTFRRDLDHRHRPHPSYLGWGSCLLFEAACTQTEGPRTRPRNGTLDAHPERHPPNTNGRSDGGPSRAVGHAAGTAPASRSFLEQHRNDASDARGRRETHFKSSPVGAASSGSTGRGPSRTATGGHPPARRTTQQGRRGSRRGNDTHGGGNERCGPASRR